MGPRRRRCPSRTVGSPHRHRLTVTLPDLPNEMRKLSDLELLQIARPETLSRAGPDQVVFADYLAEVTAAGERIKRLEAALQQCAQSSSQVAVIRALQAFRGIGFLSAVTIVAEAGDLRRFRTAPQLMAYAGTVPSESSSGSKHHRGAITKTGNSLLRHVFGEAAHHARHAPRVAGALKQRQADLPPEIVELAWRAQLRLHTRYRQLGSRIGRPKALTAVARELAGFIWAVGQLLEEVPAAA